MPNLNIEIDLEDILWDLTDREKQKLANMLYEDDDIIAEQGPPPLNTSNHNDFDEAITKLIGNSWRLTVEEEETIKKIANRIVC
jgi:hypothetical protein